MSLPKILLLNEINDDTAGALSAEFPDCRFIDARAEAIRDQHLADAHVLYGFPPIEKLHEAKKLRWIQLLSAGVPRSLCAPALRQGIAVTNLAGLYGNSIAEHTLALMSLLGRNLHIALRNQHQQKWDKSVAKTMSDLAGKTVAIVGLGDIGVAIARLAKAYGMRAVGCRRTPGPTPFVDRVYPLARLRDMLAEGDFLVVAAPLTTETTNLLGPGEFAALKADSFFVNVSRGKIADEAALVDALKSGRLAGAALDVFHAEPLAEDHPFWQMPNVVISPHYSGDTINNSALPLERFKRNLSRWLAGAPLEHVVDLERGY